MGIVRGSIPGVHYPKSSSRKQRRIPAHCPRDTVPEAIIDEVLRVPGVYRPATYIARAGPESASAELIKLAELMETDNVFDGGQELRTLRHQTE
jgi:hypothetical protein